GRARPLGLRGRGYPRPHPPPLLHAQQPASAAGGRGVRSDLDRGHQSDGLAEIPPGQPPDARPVRRHALAAVRLRGAATGGCMNAQAAVAPTIITIDVEEWFHGHNYLDHVPPATWEGQELRVERGTAR